MAKDIIGNLIDKAKKTADKVADKVVDKVGKAVDKAEDLVGDLFNLNDSKNEEKQYRIPNINDKDIYVDKYGKLYVRKSILQTIAIRAEIERNGGIDKYVYKGSNNSGFTAASLGSEHVDLEVPTDDIVVGDFDIGKAIKWIWNNSYDKYIKGVCGKCAKFVRSAIDIGFGTDPNNDKSSITARHKRPVPAYQYKDFLPKLGFHQIATIRGKEEQAKWSRDNAQPGDISVMAHGTYGHICMWTGNRWVSDFKQNNMWVYGGEGTCRIFRYG